MLRYLDHRVIKTAVGTFLAILIADYFGIKYGATAGIVTIISIQGTKKESLKIAVERLTASLIGLCISVILFYSFGYTPVVLGLFILIFMPICVKLNLLQGFLVTVVLTTHILVEKSVSPKILINELAILILGGTIAILLNLYMPKLKNKIKDTEDRIIDLMSEILKDMSGDLLCNCVSINEEKLFVELKREIELGKSLALINFNNALLSNSTYEIDLFNMKRNQYGVLKRMRYNFRSFYITYEQSLMISNFTKKIGESLGKKIFLSELKAELITLKYTFKRMELPKTREEFENRAMLAQFLNYLEDFLNIKIEFIKKYNNK
ncbi:MAG: aromatic acid exporter family protein [Fusobacteriaceae bacterium]